MPTQLTIYEALTRFLDEQQERLAPRTFRTYEDVIGPLRDRLSGYGPNTLSKADHDRRRRAYDDGDEDAFCALISADYIVDMLDEFLDYFMVRKVIAGQELVRASGTVTKRLVPLVITKVARGGLWFDGDLWTEGDIGPSPCHTRSSDWRRKAGQSPRPAGAGRQ